MDPSHAEPHATDAFDLGALRIDPAAGEIRGPVGREQLDPKVMHVLRVLHEQRGQLVPRDVLFARVWPDRIVTDDVLSRCIYQLRRQLAAAGGTGGSELIETLPKRGYRLRAQSVETGGPGASPVASTETSRGPTATALLAAGAFIAIAIYLLAAAWPDRAEPPAAAADSTAGSAALAVDRPAAPVNSIAVLPFVDMSPDGDQAYLADGLAEELLSTLAERSELVVTARTSSFSVHERGGDAIEMGRRLGAAYLVEGSVRKFGDRLRITTDLIDARDGRRLWSRKYERTLGDVFSLQDDVAREVAHSLHSTLEQRVPGASPGVAEANDAYLLGRFLFNRRGPGDLESAERHFRRAVTADPLHGRAWGALAGVYGADGSRDPDFRLRREAVERALATAPDLAESHVRAMGYHYATGDRARATHHFARATELDPDNALLLSSTAGFEHWRGRHAEAVALQSRVVARDPLSASAHGNLAAYLVSAGDYAAARAAFSKLVELNPAQALPVRGELVRLAILEGRLDAAWQEASALPPGADRDAAIAMLGPQRGEDQIAAQALARRVAAAASSAVEAVSLVEVYAYRQEWDRAWAVVSGLATRTGPVEDPNFAWELRLRESPFLATFRSDPRWQAREDPPLDR